MVFIMKSNNILLMVLAVAKFSTAYPKNVQRYHESQQFLQKDAYEPKNPSEDTQQIILNVESYVSPINDPNLKWGVPLVPFIPYKGLNELNEINTLKGHTQFTGPTPYLPHIPNVPHEGHPIHQNPFQEPHHFQGHQLGPLLGGSHYGQAQGQTQGLTNHFQTGHSLGGAHQFQRPQVSMSQQQNLLDHENPFHKTEGFGGHHQSHGHGAGPLYQGHSHHYQSHHAMASQESAAPEYSQQSGYGQNVYQKGSSYSNINQELNGRPERPHRPGRPSKYGRPDRSHSHQKLEQTQQEYYDDEDEPRKVVEASKVKQVAKEVARVVKDGGDERDVEQAVSRFLL